MLLQLSKTFIRWFGLSFLFLLKCFTPIIGVSMLMLYILYETTCPQTPQQNRVVKQKNRHILEMAKTLLIEATTQQS